MAADRSDRLAAGHAGTRRRTGGIVVLAALACAAVSACVSGRVLSGYPGYPFTSFAVSRPVDDVFPAITSALTQEGYPVDFTDRGSGFVQTRLGPDPAVPVLLNVIVGTDADSASHSTVWVAGFERTRSGDRRVNPRDEDLWKVVVAVSRRLSDRLGGTPPVEPGGPAAAGRTAQSDSASHGTE